MQVAFAVGTVVHEQEQTLAVFGFDGIIDLAMRLGQMRATRQMREHNRLGFGAFEQFDDVVQMQML